MLCGPNIINDKEFFEGLLDNFQPLLEKNISSSPWFVIYQINFKKTKGRITKMCVFFVEVVQSILEKCSVGTKPIDNNDAKATIKSLSILLNVSEKKCIIHNQDHYFVENLTNRINLKIESLFIWLHQLCTTHSPNISMELALLQCMFLQ
jgi:predicted membrane protein